VGEADRHIELAHALVVELHGLPFAVCGRAAAQVHHHVDYPSPPAAHELGHARAHLEVHPAQHAAGGARVVLLHERLVLGQALGQARGRVPPPAICLCEEPALVAVDSGLDDDWAGEANSEDAHGGEVIANGPARPNAGLARRRRWPIFAGMAVLPNGEVASLWQAGPARPQLGQGTLHVWRADLDAQEGALDGLLSRGECARAERMSRELQRRRWIRSRGLLRLLLADYLQRDPRAIRFRTGARGKPALRAEPSPSATAISFNLSHSGGSALYAFSAIGPVGVDLELARRGGHAAALAARAFGQAEAGRLQALDPVTREREFLRAWVRHEAALKCRGKGLATVGARGSGQRALITELDVGPGAAAALATSQAPLSVSCWAWTAQQRSPRR
jgi:4'-phosphopantetheinyl transferase